MTGIKFECLRKLTIYCRSLDGFHLGGGSSLFQAEGDFLLPDIESIIICFVPDRGTLNKYLVVAIGGCTKVDDKISSPVFTHLGMTTKKEPAKVKVVTVFLSAIGLQPVPLALDTAGILELCNFLALGLYLNLLAVNESSSQKNDQTRDGNFHKT